MTQDTLFCLEAITMEVSAMSKSILYHAFGINGVSYRSAKYIGNAIIFHVEWTNRHAPCPCCKTRDCLFKGWKDRYLLSVKPLPTLLPQPDTP